MARSCAAHLRLIAAGAVLALAALVHADPSPRELAILNAHRIEPTLQGVSDYLTSLRSEETRRAWIDGLVSRLVADLSSDDWGTRDAAMQTLIGLVVRARPTLNAALNADDLEVAWRARQILDQTHIEQDDKVRDQGRLIDAVCRTIEAQPIQGAAGPLLDVIPHLYEKYTLGSVRRALVATVMPADVELLRQAAQSEHEEVRIAAIAALGSALTPDTAAELHPFLNDANPLIRSAAAHALARLNDRAALPVLLDLLTSDQARVRSESSRVLQAWTSQDFGYHPYDDPAAQTTVIEQWRKWVADNPDAILNAFVQLELDEFDAFYRTVRVRSVGGGRYGSSMFITIADRPWAGEQSDFVTRRGMNVLAMHRGERVLLKAYDTYEHPEEAEAMASDFAALPAGAFIVLGINDEGIARLTPRARESLKSIGGIIDLQAFRTAYVLIGYKGITPGYAIEKATPPGAPAVFNGE